MNKFDAIIIGGGIAGMVAAYELSKKYSSILIIEKDSDIGGALASYNIWGFSIEKYYHHFFPADSQLLTLIKELGLEDRLVWNKAPTSYYIDSKVFDLNTTNEILNYPFLSLSDKLKLGLALFRLRFIRDLSYLDNISAKDWVIKNTSLRAYENFFKPLLQGKFSSKADVSAAWLCARIKKRSYRNIYGEKLGYFQGGFRILFDALSKEISKKGEILINSKVEKIIIDNNKVSGVGVGGKQYFSDNIISTIGAKSLINLINYPNPFSEKLKQIKEQCIICCLFGIKCSLINTYWLNIKSDILPFVVLIEHNNFVNFPEYKDIRLLYAVTYCEDENNNFFRMPNDKVANIYLEALEDKFSLRPSDVLWWRVSRTSEAGPVYRKGFLKLIPEIDSGIEGLYITGMIRSYPDRGINESVKDAQDCVSFIINKHSLNPGCR